jgi:hypothetical protein
VILFEYIYIYIYIYIYTHTQERMTEGRGKKGGRNEITGMKEGRRKVGKTL